MDSFRKNPSDPSKELKELEVKFSVSAAGHCRPRSVNHQAELIAKYSKGSICEHELVKKCCFPGSEDLTDVGIKVLITD